MISRESSFQRAVEKGAFNGLTAAGERRCVVLPYPPSVNALYRAVKGRSILSEKYRQWQYEAGQIIGLQRPGMVPGAVNVTVELSPPDKRRRDIDNAGFKAVLDLLVKHRVIEGDDSKFVRQITARWVESENECTVIVEPA